MSVFIRQTKRFAVCFLLLLSFAFSVQAQSDSLSYSSLPKEEIVPGRSDNFRLFDEAFYQHQLFLLGESHGVQKPQEVDFELLKHLNQKLGIRYYIAEVDATKAHYLNQYLQMGDESTLMLVFRSWIQEKAQWANKDFFRKIQKIRSLNQTLPANRQIQFVGIDRIHDKALIGQHLTELLQGRKVAKAIRALADSLIQQLIHKKPDSLAANLAIQWLNDWQKNPNTYEKNLGNSTNSLRHLLTNIAYLKTIKSRETTIFTNFKTLLPTLNNEKLYGFWGYYHVLQRPMANGSKPFACQINESDLYLHNNIVSITFKYLDSYSMVPTAYLPPFWQDKGTTYTRLDKFNNDNELMHYEGIEAMRAATRPNTLTLFALDRPGSFALKTPIRIKYAPYMPPSQQLKFDEKRPTTDYFQYVILVRNSDMTEPLVP